MSNPLVSVLVPIYGVDKYIERCARSIFEQTYQNLEIIFVNDCTPDNSITILSKVLDGYPQRKKQTRIINHEINKGLAAARKTALLASTGYYIQNYDSDDYVEIDMIENMVHSAQAEDADITICDWYYVYSETDKKCYISVNPSLSPSILLQQVISGEVHSGVVNKLIKRSLYFDNNIYPIDGLNMCEDLSVMFRLVYNADKIAYVSKPLYYYVIDRAGAYTSQKMSLSQQKNRTDLIVLFEEFFNCRTITPEISKEIHNYKVRLLCKIALYGSLDYYKQTQSYFVNIKLKDIISQRIIFIMKISGLLLYLKLNIFLKMFRLIYSTYHKYMNK